MNKIISKGLFKNTFFLLGFMIKLTPLLFLLNLILCILSGIIGAASTILFTKIIFIKVETGSPFSEILRIIIIMAVVLTLNNAFTSLFNKRIKPSMETKFKQKIQITIYEKARSMDYSLYENPEFYNNFIWATRESDSRIIAVCSDICSFISALISSLAVAAVVVSIDFTIAACLILGVIFSYALKYLGIRLEYKKKSEIVPEMRKTEYVNRVYSLCDYAKQIKTSHISSPLDEFYDDSIKKIKKINRKYGVKTAVLGIFESLSALLFGIVFVYILLVFKSNGNLSVSLASIATVAASTSKMSSLISSVFSSLSNLPSHSLYAGRFIEFLNCKSEASCSSAKIPPLNFNEISFNNVSFSYPQSDKKVLDGISLSIKKNQKIAIVGSNGSGKSTLIKLLVRLYEPSSGSIEIDGTPINEFDIDRYRKGFSTLFQDFRLFSLPVCENIVGDIFDKNNIQQQQNVENALASANADGLVDNMSNGLDTVITREFAKDGVNLSGGEMQKIAIARLFARDCGIFILDEPSSALDVESEYLINREITEKSNGKTVVFISHRLSSTRFADKIFFIDNGHISECGTHEELMRSGGRYSYMYKLQAEKYN